jgi:cobalt-zinc-cadmium efflux system outer membrane protein
MHRRSLYSIAVFLLAVTASVRAQTQSAATTPLTIDEAVKEALDHNLTLIAERYSVSVARARTLTASLRPNPVLTLSGYIPDHSVYDNDISPIDTVVRTDVILERGGKRESRIQVAQEDLSIAELQLLNTVRTTVFDVQDAFVEVALAKVNLALARESLDGFNRLVQVNTERVRTGDLAGVELERVRLAALQFQNDVRQQEAKLTIARGHLKSLLGRTGPESIDVTGELRRDAAPVDVEAVRARALRERPDLRALNQQQARSLADIRLQLAQGKIDYTVSGEYHHQKQGLPTPAAGNMYGVFFSAPIPIFNRNQGEIARAREEAQQTEARTHALEAGISSEVQTAYESYSAARQVVDTIESQMLTKAENVRSTTEYSYREGEASFVEFLDAVRAFNETMQTYNEARADYARSLYQLDSISGVVMP